MRFLILAFLCGAPIALAQSEVQVKLQWFDARSELVDLDWPASVEWNWEESGANRYSPSAQVWVEIPERLNLRAADNALARVLKSPGISDDQFRRQLLILTAKSAKLTAKLVKEEKDLPSQNVGLVVALVQDAPKMLVHESCLDAGLTLRQKKAGANFLFIAISCKELKTSVGVRHEITASLSEDAVFTSAKAGSSQLVRFLYPPKNQRGAAISERLRVANLLNEAELAEFEVVPGGAEAAALQTRLPTPLNESAKTPVQRSVEKVVEWGFSLGLAHTRYTLLKLASEFQPTELALELGVQADMRLFKSKVPFQTVVALPLWSFIPGFFKIPASGFYKVAALIDFFAQDMGKLRFRFSSGFELGEIRLNERASEAGFFLGPQLRLATAGRGFGGQAAVTPLFGSRRGSGFESFELSAEAFTEISMEALADRQKSWELLLKADYAKLKATDSGSGSSDFVKVSLGVRTWL